KKLEREIAENKTLPLPESNLVFGEGNADCQVMFIGEAPGFTENELRRPFVGRAGKLLDQLLTEIGWQRNEVYITNIVKRRPPENRDPLPTEIEAYKPYLAWQIEIIKPKIIATLGRFAMNYFLPFAKISSAHGQLFDWDERIILPLYHPAAALRATAVLNDLRADFKKLPDIAAGKIAVELPKIEMKRKKTGPPQAQLF
ncbi:MAG: DNA polymerase bacteriophage-type, partial [Parcubacteria group bacterium Gr01-1014_73]